MRLLLIVCATITAVALMACNGSENPTSRIVPENTVVETPEAPEPAPTAAPLTPASPENTLIETPGYTGVIVSENGVSEFAYLFDQASIGFWEPSVDDVSRAEERIRRCLVSMRDDPKLDTYQRESVAYILENLEEYRRQYVGIDANDAQRIWTNAFYSDNLHVDWKRVPVDVDGGGRHYWQIEYDPAKDDCFGFSVHGES